jgi:hypothetical protein
MVDFCKTKLDYIDFIEKKLHRHFQRPKTYNLVYYMNSIDFNKFQTVLKVAKSKDLAEFTWILSYMLL